MSILINTSLKTTKLMQNDELNTFDPLKVFRCDFLDAELQNSLCGQSLVSNTGSKITVSEGE